MAQLKRISPRFLGQAPAIGNPTTALTWALGQVGETAEIRKMQQEDYV